MQVFLFFLDSRKAFCIHDYLPLQTNIGETRIMYTRIILKA